MAMRAEVLRGLVAAGLVLAATLSPAQTLRWSSAGDVQTMDPHAQNELLTNAINAQVYEFLVGRDKQLGLVPQLATDWQQTGPLNWRFHLRPGVRFHDGTPFGADDVVYSVNRAKAPTSAIAVYANALGEVKKLDERTVEFQLTQVNPIFLQHLGTINIMSRRWAEAHQVGQPQDIKRGQETYAAFHTNGTGPFMLVSRQPDVKTVFVRNPNWWGKPEGNLQQVVYMPIGSDATRLAALITGEIDFVLDPSPRNVPRLRRMDKLKIIDGLENRVLFIGMDQARDRLLYGQSGDGRNPFKDPQVRRALYQAIDIETLKTKLMSGQAVPTGAVMPSPLGSLNDPAIEKRLPYDLAAARRLMAEAGYADGFEVTLDCPNNRYINDEAICIALAGMWAQLKVKVRVNAMPRTLYFTKLQKLDTSMYLLGWGGSITDPETTFTPIYRNRGDKGVGSWNFGNHRDDALDAAAAASSREGDPARRAALIREVFRLEQEAVHYVPLHRQVIPWAARQNVSVVHRADNWLEWQWITVK